MSEQSEGVRIALAWLDMDANEVMRLGKEGLEGYLHAAWADNKEVPQIELDAILAWAEAEVAKQKQHFVLAVEGDSGKVRMKVSQLIVPVEHAFGDNARFKGRDVKPELVLVPENLYVEEPLKEGETLQEFLTRVTDQAVIAMEEVVKKADIREKVREEGLKAEARLVLEQAMHADDEVSDAGF